MSLDVQALVDDDGDVVQLVVRSLDGEPITGTTLRSIRMEDVRRRAAAVVRPERADPDLVAVARANGPTAATLDAVAIEYRAARAMRLPTTIHLCEVFGAPRSTVGHWVKLARERGHL